MDWRPLQSRKVLTALTAAVSSIVIVLGSKYGLQLDTEIVVTLVAAVVALAMTNMTGIAIEDHGEKSANTVVNVTQDQTSSPQEPTAPQAPTAKDVSK